MKITTLCTWIRFTVLFATFVGAPLAAADPGGSTERSVVFDANRRLGRGVNLGNFLEVPRDQNWGVDIAESHLKLIRQAGFDSIRMPVKWSDYAATEAPYTIEPAFFARIDRWLDRAEQEKLNVVLNIHHYDGLDDDPESHAERFAAIWKQIAERYRSRGDWLYFELHNEPHDQLNDHWNAILREGLAAVRQSNPTRPVIVGPIRWNRIAELPQLDLPDDPNLIVTVHMYNPHEFTHQGASWAGPEVRSIRGRMWGSDQERAALEEEFQKAGEWGKSNSRPLFLGEFGAYGAAPQESRVRWTRAVVEQAEKHQMSWAYWEFAAGFGVYDLDKMQWREDLLGALMPSQ
ncbi:Endoglucanase H precursor [Stieleria maiorica]|uniref:Endoglucanase H n=1 Tax=Stieleria maiorica TaxID=2795974 RepID=A0A5B9MD98_9BACT|nr:glycoside hydrolase family 5 protein [Stieleria maiorica]QEF98216.1 Endoglucanase H precursor [Stieleria maiorica]